MDDEVGYKIHSVRKFPTHYGHAYNVLYGFCGCLEAFIPEAALNWNPEIPVVRRLKDYLSGNSVE